MGFLANKKALVLGIASKKSIAYGIAKAMQYQGAEVAITFQNERLEERARNFATELSSPFFLKCDVDEDDDIKYLFEKVSKYWDKIDIIVHSIAFAPREMLQGNYLDNLTREDLGSLMKQAVIALLLLEKRLFLCFRQVLHF